MRKICIIIDDYPLGTSTSLISTIQQFTKSDYSVEIFIHEEGFNVCPVSFADGLVKLTVVKRGTLISNLLQKIRVPSLFNKKVQKVSLRDLADSASFYLRSHLYSALFKKNELTTNDSEGTFEKKFLFICNLVFPSLIHFSKKIEGIIQKDYDAIIGVEPKGLIIAHLLVCRTKINTKVLYFNMELLLEKECKKPREQMIKILERACNQRSFLTVIQDRERAGHLIADNSLKPEKVLCLPVCSFGPPVREKSFYLRERFNIRENQKIILYAGNIIDWSMCLEIAQSAKKWSDNFVLVLHTWRTDIQNDEYIQKIITFADNKKIFLSLTPLAYPDLAKLIASADYGVVMYKNLGENFVETGNSSNKLAQYLQSGLPVITNDYPSFRNLIDRYNCGVCVDEPEKIGEYVKTIDAEYIKYRENAFKCYSEMFDMSKYFSMLEKTLADKKAEN